MKQTHKAAKTQTSPVKARGASDLLSGRFSVPSNWQCSAVLETAKAAGYLSGTKSERVGGRVSHRLISAAKAKSGIESQTELLEYALSKVALEDDYGKKLLGRKGAIPDDIDL